MSSFGRYTLVRRVGTGGMAEIWKARASGPAGFEKILAIKKVLPHLVEDGEFIDMFVEEAKLVAQLVHPNIVQVFDFGKVGKLDYFIAMEYVAGSNLAQVLRRLSERGARMPLEVALYIVAEACRGLGHAHKRTDPAGNELRIVHRDVSPQNILVSFGGEVKVTDFGIAKVASALSRTADGHVRGKLAYMSPEQANTQSLDSRSDLFSLGVVLYELCTGRRLLYGTSSSEIFAKVTNFRVPGDEDLSGLPHEVRTLVQTALQPDPDERFQDAMEMESAITQALGSDGFVQARHALASVMQRLFDDERKLEMTGAEPVAVVPAAPEFAETVASAEGSLFPESAHREVIPSAEPDREPSQPSGLTLNKSQKNARNPVNIVSQPADPTVIGPPPSARHAAAAPPPQAENALARAARVSAYGLALVVAAVAGAAFLPNFLESPAPTPLPTAFATSTPEIAAATAEEMPTAVAEVTEEPFVAETPEPTPVRPVTPRATPVRTPVVVATAPPLTPRPTQVAVLANGFLTVNARPWVSVYVDGKMVIAETPLRRHKLPAGRHVIRFQNSAAKFTAERIIEIGADGEKNVFVDVKTGQVSVR